jgi:hypothetical protein
LTVIVTLAYALGVISLEDRGSMFVLECSVILILGMIVLLLLVVVPLPIGGTVVSVVSGVNGRFGVWEGATDDDGGGLVPRSRGGVVGRRGEVRPTSFHSSSSPHHPPPDVLPGADGVRHPDDT